MIQSNIENDKMDWIHTILRSMHNRVYVSMITRDNKSINVSTTENEKDDEFDIEYERKRKLGFEIQNPDQQSNHQSNQQWNKQIKHKQNQLNIRSSTF